MTKSEMLNQLKAENSTTKTKTTKSSVKDTMLAQLAKENEIIDSGTQISSYDVNKDNEFDVRDLVAAKKQTINSTGNIKANNQQITDNIKNTLITEDAGIIDAELRRYNYLKNINDASNEIKKLSENIEEEKDEKKKQKLVNSYLKANEKLKTNISSLRTLADSQRNNGSQTNEERYVYENIYNYADSNLTSIRTAEMLTKTSTTEDYKSAIYDLDRAKKNDRTLAVKVIDYLSGIPVDYSYSEEEENYTKAAWAYYSSHEGIDTVEKAKKELKKKGISEEKKRALNYMITGKGGSILENIELGIQAIVPGVMGAVEETTDALIAEPVNAIAKLIGCKDDIFHIGGEHKKFADESLQKISANSYSYGDKENISGIVTQTVISTLPAIGVTFLTGGASAPTLANEASAITNLIKNPVYWTSFATTYGNTYYKYKSSGKSYLESTVTAMPESLINAAIEISGGNEELAKNLIQNGFKKGVIASGKDAVISAVGEAGEEILQGGVSNTFERVANKDADFSDKRMFSDAKQLLEEAKGGFIGGLFLSIGQVNVNTIANYKTLNQYSNLGKKLRNSNTGIDYILDYGKTCDNFEIRELSQKGKVDNVQLGQIYSYMCSDVAKSFSVNSLEEATQVLNDFVNQVGNENPAVKGVFIPKYIETVKRLGGNAEYATTNIIRITAENIDVSISTKGVTEGVNPTQAQGVSDTVKGKVETSTDINSGGEENVDTSLPARTETAEQSGVKPSSAEIQSTAEQSIFDNDISDTAEITYTEPLSGVAKTETVTVSQKAYIKKIGKLLGIKVSFADNITNANGYIVLKDEKGKTEIVFNNNPDAPIKTLVVHELVHFAKAFTKSWNGFVKVIKQTKKFHDFVENYQCYNNKNSTAIKDETSFEKKLAIIREDVIEEYKNKVSQELSPAEAEEEIICRFCGEAFFSSEKTQDDSLKSIIKGLNDYDRNKITRFFSDLVNWFKAKLGKNNVTMPLTKLEKAWIELVKNTESTRTDTGINGVRYSIGYTIDNIPVAFVEENILDGIPKSEWVKTVKKIIAEKFSGGIPISGRLIKVNKISKNEYTNSKYSQYLKSSDGTIYADKFKTANNLDDVILATTNYIKEDLKHSRNDNIKEFARGDVLIRVGKNDYSAKVIVGITNSQNMVLYDVVDFEKTDFEIKRKTPRSAMQNAGSQRNEMPSTNNIPNNSENVNKNFSTNDSEYLELAKNPEKNEARLRELVDEAAKENGFSTRMYHGSNKSDDIKVFNDWQYFTENKQYAKRYANKKLYEVYVKVENWFDTRDSKAKEYFNKAKQEYGLSNLNDTGLPDWTDGYDICDFIEENNLNYDGVILDEGGDLVNGKPIMRGNSYVIRKSTQVKSADLVTYDDEGNIIPLSERFNSDKEDIRYSVSNNESVDDEVEYDQTYAANKKWDKAIEEHGAIDEKAETKVPKSTDGRTAVSRVVNNIVNHAALSDNDLNGIKVKTMADAFSHEIYTDKKAIEKAEKSLKNGTALRKWKNAVGKSRITKGDIAIGEILLRQAIKEGNTSAMLEIMAELSEIATRAGQVSQAYSMISKMNGFGKLMTLQKMVDALNVDLEKKLKNKFKPITIDETLAGQLARTKLGENTDSIYEDILANLAEQVPSTFLDKWNAWRYTAMLLNPRTHIRNIAGNAIMLPVVRIKDGIASVMEKIFINKEERTKSFIVKKPYKELAKKYLNSDIVQAALHGNKYNDQTGILQKRRIFKSRILNFLSAKNSDLLEMEDIIFKNKHFVHAFGGFLQARGIDVNEAINAQTLETATKYAISEALKATFNDANKLATAINGLASKKKVADVLVNGIIPFKKTPLNIVERGIEYSPVGILKTLSKGIYDLQSGNITTTEFIDGLSAGVSGTIPFVVGAFLSSLGIALAGFGDDKKDKFAEMEGGQEYALYIGDKSYTIDWAAPACIPFFMGVELGKYFKEKDISFSDIPPLGWKMLDPIINLSCLDGVRNVIKNSTYNDEDAGGTIGGLISSIFSSYFSQAVPTIGGSIARTFDDTRRVTYIDKNNTILDRTTQRFIQTVQSKIPFLENKKSKKIDAWGQTVKTGDVYERIFENFISPGYYSKREHNKVNDELIRLSEVTDSSVFPSESQKYIIVDKKRIDFTAEQYEVFAKIRGQKSFELTEAVMKTDWYSNLSDKEKSESIKKVYTFAYEWAKSQISDYEMGKKDSFMSECSNDTIAYYLIKKAIDSIDD